MHDLITEFFSRDLGIAPEDLWKNFNVNRKVNCARLQGLSVLDFVRLLLEVDENSLVSTYRENTEKVRALIESVIDFLDWGLFTDDLRGTSSMEIRWLTRDGADALPYPPSGKSVAQEAEARCEIKLRYPEMPCLDVNCFDGSYFDAYIPLELLRITCGCISSSNYYKMFDRMRPYRFRPSTLSCRGYRSFYYFGRQK
jgi:hypothetical protein